MCYNARSFVRFSLDRSGRMTPEHEELRKALDQLQAQLDQMRAVDPDVARQLGTTIDEAKDVLAGGGGHTHAPHSLVEQLKQAVLEYEASHPTLAGNLGALVRALGQMGI
jgi:predicted NBD/HSP70 family sugar kinase